MIVRVSIDNLVIVDHAEFEPGPQLTAVTGETGAGKTLLATAIGLLFGADAEGAQVGARGDHAWVEGEFEVADSLWADPALEVFAQLRPEPDSPLVLARKISGSGRSRALAWGRTISKTDLAAAGRLLVASAGQHAGRKLVSPAWQRALVDKAGDAAHVALLDAMHGAHAGVVAAAAEHARVNEAAARISERADAVLDDLSRIDGVHPSLDDFAELRTQRDRARNHAALHEALATAYTAVADDESPVSSNIGRAAHELINASGWDTTLEPLAAQMSDLQQGLASIASELRGKLDELHDAPSTIDDIEDRLSAYDELNRRFGGTVEAVLARWELLREEARLVSDSAGVLAEADRNLAAQRAAAVTAAAAVTVSRQALAATIAAGVTELLRELGMADSIFEIAVEPVELTVAGGDRVELRIAPHASLPPRPISEIASGGELSRIALALHVATGEGDAPTLIFDEIDAGIGGHTAHAIASMLKRLAQHAQVICITHLPQVAARADDHVVITKQSGATSLATLHGDDQVLDELCRMLGAEAGDAAAREHAQQLRGPRFLQSAQPALLPLADLFSESHE